MMPLVIILCMLFCAMLICCIAMKHEHREEEKADAYLFRHRYDEDKLRATAEVAAAYNEFVAAGLIK